METFDSIGNRICIIGPSSSGKSTLAKAIGEKKNLPVCYLDQMAHNPNSNWIRKDIPDFKIEHEEFIQHHSEWIMDGNYQILMRERFAQASFVIWLNFSKIGSLYRYLKRSFQNQNKRVGNLKGAPSEFSWGMVNFILFTAKKYRRIYREVLEESQVSFLELKSFDDLLELNKIWELKNPLDS